MVNIFLWFIFYSFIGWSYESALYSAKQGHFVNSGMLRGCICPIYGLGALMAVQLFGKAESAAVIIFGAAIAACALEYASSWLIERLFGARWWDYSDWPANINGRISLLSGLAFGIMALLVVKGLHPAVAAVTGALPEQARSIAASALFLLFAIDLCVSANHCRNMPKTEDVNIVLKLPFDFLPKPGPRLAALANFAKGTATVAFDRGTDLLAYITEKVKDFLGL